MKVLVQVISSIIAIHRTIIFNYSFTANTIDVSYVLDKKILLQPKAELINI
jgi:hypothetical protein